MIIDLTMELHEGITAYPSHGRSVLSLSPVMKHADFLGTGRRTRYADLPVSFEVSQWILSDQAGTHMDAPFHVDPAHSVTIERVPLETAWGPAVWLDCTTAATESGAVSAQALRDAADEAGVRIERGDILVLRTGASDDAVSDPAGYATTFRGLTRDAAEHLRAVGVRCLAIDCVTIESPATAATADVHTILLRPSALGLPDSDVIGVVENLVHVDTIPVHRFHFAALPLPLRGAAGSPVRAVAVVEGI
ncbi:cyclase family protein [Amycolatopsis sp. NPDC059027]|uniref:cyclase family protein n=1 Tax=unclassified Amycolatopsis TaxID=2618356 RepID=UPI00367268D3